MAELVFFSGTMDCGKSTLALQMDHNHRQRGRRGLIFTKLDRAGASTLSSRLGLSAPTYQGITGLVGVLHAELEERGIPTISLRVGVPHYLIHTEHPRAVAALLGHLSHVLAIPIDADLDEMIERWETIHDEAVADDEQLQAYVRMLEADYDRRAEATLREADDLAARFEEFLREQGDDPTD